MGGTNHNTKVNTTIVLFLRPEKKESAQRFYGFLCNPKPSDHRYCVCILVRYASKTKHETDEIDLKIVEEMRTLPAVQKAIDDYFKEKP